MKPMSPNIDVIYDSCPTKPKRRKKRCVMCQRKKYMRLVYVSLDYLCSWDWWCRKCQVYTY